MKLHSKQRALVISQEELSIVRHTSILLRPLAIIINGREPLQVWPMYLMYSSGLYCLMTDPRPYSETQMVDPQLLSQFLLSSAD